MLSGRMRSYSPATQPAATARSSSWLGSTPSAPSGRTSITPSSPSPAPSSMRGERTPHPPPGITGCGRPSALGGADDLEAAGAVGVDAHDEGDRALVARLAAGERAGLGAGDA